MSGSETDKFTSVSNENSWAESELDSEVDADCGVVSIGTVAILASYHDERIVRESSQERDEEDVDMLSKYSGIDIWEKNYIKRMVCKDFDLYYAVMFFSTLAGDCDCMNIYNFYDVSIFRCYSNERDNTLLNGMREHRCCSEIQEAIGNYRPKEAIQR